MVLNPGTIVNTEREVVLLKAQLKALGSGKWKGSLRFARGILSLLSVLGELSFMSSIDFNVCVPFGLRSGDSC